MTTAEQGYCDCRSRNDATWCALCQRPKRPIAVQAVPVTDEWKASVASSFAMGRHGSSEPGHAGLFETCLHPRCVAARPAVEPR